MKPKSLNAITVEVTIRHRKKLTLMGETILAGITRKEKFHYGLAGAGDASAAAAYLGSLACFRIASYNFLIPVMLA